MSEQLPITSGPEVVDGAAIELVEQPQPTIHDQAYWDQDAERLAQFYEGYRGLKGSELEPAQKDQLITFMWKQLFIDHQIIKQLALEVAPKPARKRTPKVPKAALPELSEGDPDAA
jgi:hypothetical protein